LADKVDPRVLRRSAFFAGMASRVSDELPDLSRQTELRADAPLLMARAYFLLSDAYKPRRNDAGSLTDEYKRAALSALAVMAIRPFSPLAPDNVTSMQVYLANPLLALACANAWSAERNLFEFYPFDYLKRFYMSLHAVRLPSLDAFVEWANSGEEEARIDAIDLSSAEVALIDDWVLKFHMLCHLRR
jgi:hypothetical protein